MQRSFDREKDNIIGTEKDVQKIKEQGNVTVMKALLVENDFITEYKLLRGVRKEVANTTLMQRGGLCIIF